MMSYWSQFFKVVLQLAMSILDVVQPVLFAELALYHCHPASLLRVICFAHHGPLDSVSLTVYVHPWWPLAIATIGTGTPWRVEMTSSVCTLQ
jgi:hypothetical protein